MNYFAIRNVMVLNEGFYFIFIHPELSALVDITSCSLLELNLNLRRSLNEMDMNDRCSCPFYQGEASLMALIKAIFIHLTKNIKPTYKN